MAQANDDQEALRERLRQACARMRSAARGGPEWDAAMAEVEELERRAAHPAEARRGERAAMREQRQRIIVEFEDGPCGGQREDLSDLPGTTKHPDVIAVSGATYRLRRLLGGVGYYGLWKIERQAERQTS